MKRLVAAGAMLLVCTLAPPHAWSQLQSATLGGTVTDATGALIPGVEVTARNNGTEIATTTVTNETGSYAFTLQPGTYTVSAALPSFQTQTYSGVTLGTTQRLRLNFTLQVAGVAQTVEVLATADTLLAETSSSVGDVLPEQTVQALPNVGNNILNMLDTLSGVRMNADGVNGTFAGLSTRYVNVQRDGIDASASARWQQSGMQTSTFMNPDLVGELRVIVAPVDAELGRGNGMFLVTTRSGTNQYRGSAVWSVRNSALDANTWGNNNDVDPVTGAWSPTAANWINRNQYR